ncbi:MAG: hypothetical protein KBD63_01600 [Bacteriovoracaceae bacterium]|nr:hypothetical protein [Bacteriovoracaceae bacterium]
MVSSDLWSRCSEITFKQGKFPKGEFSVCTDSRELKQGQLFVALAGEFFNALDFLPAIIDKKPSAIVFNQSDFSTKVQPFLKEQDIYFLGVKDTLLFYQELASQHILQWLAENKERKVIGIAGSNGKTTTRQMLSFLLTSIAPDQVIYTKENFNNHIGVPKTIFEINKKITHAIIEMGSNHPGELKVLCDIAHPNCGLITNIGKEHLEFFGDEKGVFKEERVLYDCIMQNTQDQGFFILNLEDNYLKNLPIQKNCLSISKDIRSSFQFKFQGSYAELEFQGRKILIKNNFLIGEHNFFNMAVSYALAITLFPAQAENLAQAMALYRPSKNRSFFIQQKEKAYFLDAYNANPSSMLVSVEGFKQWVLAKSGNLDSTFIVVGDMNELGQHSPAEHELLGYKIKNLGFHHVVFIGRFSAFFAKGFAAKVLSYETVDQFIKEDWDVLHQRYKEFFFKASRSVKLEKLLERSLDI